MVEQDIIKEEIEELEGLCTEIFSRKMGVKLERVRITNIERASHIPTKSDVFRAELKVESDGSVVGIPNIVGIKKHKPHRGTSDPHTLPPETIADRTYKTEKAVLGLGKEKTGGVYPELYDLWGYGDESRTLVREYIPGNTLDQLAKEGAKWESVSGPSLSTFLQTIVTLHRNGDIIAKELNERGLLKWNILEEVDPEHIAIERAKKFVRYFKKLAEGLGKTLNPTTEKCLYESVYELEKEYGSRKEFLTIVDGELDVFPHHAMLDKIPDAGGVEIGGIGRDLAVYGAPVFMKLFWKNNPDEMVQTVTSTYIDILEKKYGIEVPPVYKELLPLATPCHEFEGCYRRAASIDHWTRADRNYPTDEEIAESLNNSHMFLGYFSSKLGGEHKIYPENIGMIANQIGLMGEYRFSPKRSERSEEVSRPARDNDSLIGLAGSLFSKNNKNRKL